MEALVDHYDINSISGYSLFCKFEANQTKFKKMFPVKATIV